MAKEKLLVELGATKELMSLIDAKHGTPPRRIPELPQSDLDLLRRLVQGDIRDAARVKALALLAKIDPQGACELLAEVLLNQDEDKGLRAVAAVAISHCRPRARVQEVLLRALRATKSRLLEAKIAKSLGRIGDQEALESLAALRGSPAGVGSQADLARTLIAARLDLQGDIPPVEPSRGDLPPSAGLVPVGLEPMGPGEIEEVLESFDDTFHGIEIDPGVAFRIKIGGDDQPLLLNREAFLGGSFEPLIRRRLLLGLLTLRSQEAGTYSVDHLICCDPGKDGTAHLSFFSTTGQPTYAGEVEFQGDSLGLELADAVASTRFPLRLKARIGPGRVEMGQGVLLTRAKQERKNPAPLSPSASSSPS